MGSTPNNYFDQFTDGQMEYFIRLAKEVNLSVKQVAPLINVPVRTLYEKWRKVPRKRSNLYKQVHKRHRGRIVEMILFKVDLFEISEVFNYQPRDVIRFIQAECGPGTWKWRKCRICDDNFVSFGEVRICGKVECIAEGRSLKVWSA